MAAKVVFFRKQNNFIRKNYKFLGNARKRTEI